MIVVDKRPLPEGENSVEARLNEAEEAVRAKMATPPRLVSFSLEGFTPDGATLYSCWQDA